MTVRGLRVRALVVGSVGIAIACAWAALHYTCQAVLITGPMLQSVTPDRFSVVWRLHPGQPSMLRVRGQGTTDWREVIPAVEGGFQVALVGGLEPGGVYEYQISSGGRLLASAVARSAPENEQSFRFVALGDTGVGDRHQFAVARRIGEYRPDLVLHTGDLIYPRGRPESSPGKFYVPYADLLAVVPFYPTPGNHEYRDEPGSQVPDNFVLPANAPRPEMLEKDYWFDWAGVRFVSVDSNHDEPHFAEVVVPWLDQALAAAPGNWKIVFFHEPILTHGKYDPAVKLERTILPVLEVRGVALVLCGHNHMYERSRPWRGGHPAEGGGAAEGGDGIVHLTTGAGGANLAEARLPMPESIAAWCDSEHSFTVVDVTADQLFIRQIGESGRLIDESRIHRPATGASR